MITFADLLQKPDVVCRVLLDTNVALGVKRRLLGCHLLVVVLLQEWYLLRLLLLLIVDLLLHECWRHDVAVCVVRLLDFLLHKRVHLVVMVRACDRRFGRGVCLGVCVTA